jgi:hypothetical protein
MVRRTAEGYLELAGQRDAALSVVMGSADPREESVSVFSRDPGQARKLVPGVAEYVQWHPDRPLTGECSRQLAAADAVVYLAGGPLFDGQRHTRVCCCAPATC